MPAASPREPHAAGQRRGAARTRSSFTDGPGTPRRVPQVWPGGHGEGLRRSHDDAAGVKPGASPVDRMTVNVGTVHVALHNYRPARAVAWMGASPAEGRGRGRRSTRTSGEPATSGARWSVSTVGRSTSCTCAPSRTSRARCGRGAPLLLDGQAADLRAQGRPIGRRRPRADRRVR